MFDVLVIGSGPAGVQVVDRLSRERLRIGLVDPGKVEEHYRGLIPQESFARIRRNCRRQQRFFLGDNDEALALEGTRLAAHLTPPRQYLLEGTDEHLPFRSETLHNFQTLARGGLGAAWGAGVCTFSPSELEEAGMDASAMRRCYAEAARSAGISLDPRDDTTPLVCDLAEHQPSLEIDDNALSLLHAYGTRRTALNRKGFRLGKAPLAVLSRNRERRGVLRQACTYHNMDYYSDHGGSVYRPAHTLRELQQNPGFEHLSGLLALDLCEQEDRVAVVCRSLRDGRTSTLTAHKVVLAAGALNTARLVAGASRKFDRRLPLLANEVRFFPSVNLSMLGRPQGSRKYSLAQLVGVFQRASGEALISYFFSYDSLLLFRLVRDMPLPAWLGHHVARALVSSLTIATLHFPDYPTRLKWIRVTPPPSGDGLPQLEGQYRSTFREEQRIDDDSRRFKATLRTLRCLPLSVINRGAGTAVHYGGTLPFSSAGEPFLSCQPTGRLNGTRHVYVADSAPWKFLPAKGLTLTIMAHARLVAGEVARGLVD